MDILTVAQTGNQWLLVFSLSSLWGEGESVFVSLKDSFIGKNIKFLGLLHGSSNMCIKVCMEVEQILSFASHIHML